MKRNFAHVCETGGARRTWLRGLEQINKRYQIHTAARNLGLLKRDLFGIGKPRVLQDGLKALEEAAAALSTAWIAQITARRPSCRARSVWDSIRRDANRTRPQPANLAVV